MFVSVSKKHINQIKKHSEREFPREAVGALIGKYANEKMEIEEIIELKNETTENPARRFFVSPESVYEIEMQCRAGGKEIVGWYHSHPNGSPDPSEEDLKNAFPFYAYFIVSVVRGQAKEIKCWRLNATSNQFEECALGIEN
jgi:proteasome lid subunit RPN8/RPN11